MLGVKTNMDVVDQAMGEYADEDITRCLPLARFATAEMSQRRSQFWQILPLAASSMGKM
jgi:hypothetical protein